MNAPPIKANGRRETGRRDNQFDANQYRDVVSLQAPPAPHSVEAEQGVLCSMLQPHGGSEAIAEVVGEINEEYFYVPAHQTIYNVLVDLWNAGQAIDLVTFTQELRDRNLLESVGGAAAITHLFNFVPSAVNVGYYIDIVQEKYILRSIIAVGTESVRRAYEAQSAPGEILASLESRTVSLQSIHGRNGADGLTTLTPNEILALPTDEYSCLLGDRLLAKGQSIVIAGQPGLGKSRLALQLAVACNTGRDFCGIETHARGLRWLVLQTENGSERLRKDCAALIKWAGDGFDQSLLHIQVFRTDSDGFLNLSDRATVARIEATIRQIQPDGVIADPLRDFSIGDLNSDADMIATLRELTRIVWRGNPGRALVLLHHALTGRAGAAKAFGLERTGFARNSKALLGWARGMVNVIPGAEDNNDQLVLTCGKNSNGKEFPPIAVRLNPDSMIYEPDDSFDMEGWREKVSAPGGKAGVKPQIFRELLKKGQDYDKKKVVELVREEKGIRKTRAYELIDQAVARKILRHNKTIKTYAFA
jgi:hypothetical protein